MSKLPKMAKNCRRLLLIYDPLRFIYDRKCNYDRAESQPWKMRGQKLIAAVTKGGHAAVVDVGRRSDRNDLMVEVIFLQMFPSVLASCNNKLNILQLHFRRELHCLLIPVAVRGSPEIGFEGAKPQTGAGGRGGPKKTTRHLRRSRSER